MTTKRIEAAKRAVQLMGGPVKAARELEIENYQTVQSWESNGVPVAWCVKVERLLKGGMTRPQLRPDDWECYWPELAASKPTAMKAHKKPSPAQGAGPAPQAHAAQKVGA